MWHLTPLNAIKQIIHYSQIQIKMARSTKCIYNLNKSLSSYNYLCLIKKHPTPYPDLLWSTRSCPFIISLKNNQECLPQFRSGGGGEIANSQLLLRKRARWVNSGQNYEVSPDCSKFPLFFPTDKSVLWKELVLYYSHQVESQSPSWTNHGILICLCMGSFLANMPR